MIQDTRLTPGQLTLRRYQGYGLLGGATLGLIVGVMLSGPWFYEWPVVALLAVMSTCAATGALAGWLFLPLILGAVAGAPLGEVNVDGDSGSGSEGGSGGGGD